MTEPRLFLLRRGPNDKETALSQVISVDEVRKLKSFFALSAADGGRRVAIVDAVDEMNTAAANALLKLLEEPAGAGDLPSGRASAAPAVCRRSGRAAASCA